jgi:hypothetical protein
MACLAVPAGFEPDSGQSWDAGLPEEQEGRLAAAGRDLSARLGLEVCEARDVCSGLPGQANKAMDTAMAGNPSALAEAAAGMTPGELAARRWGCQPLGFKR